MQFLHVYLPLLYIQIAIGIDLKKCPALKTPENGYVICDHLLGAFCAPVCNSGYNYETTPASAYVCNPVSRSWATYPAGYPLPWPNCVISTQTPISSSSSPMKKSQVYEKNTGTAQGNHDLKNDSLWQRMLQLTSELSQKKVNDAGRGATRSELNRDSNSKEALHPTVSSNGYTTTNIYAQQQDYNQQTEFERLQQYWNEYYKNYYHSLSMNKEQEGNAVGELSVGSPWSTDPEQVQGALDKDAIGKADQPNATTLYQNWNSYLQSFYKYPTQSTYKNYNATIGYSATVPNSSSDHFIDNVISNDLQANKVSDASVNRDLYYEDQLIHFEEQMRPYLNLSNYPTANVANYQTKASWQNNMQQSNETNQLNTFSTTNSTTQGTPYRGTNSNNSYESNVALSYNNPTTESSKQKTRTTDRINVSTGLENTNANLMTLNTSEQGMYSAASDRFPARIVNSSQDTITDGHSTKLEASNATYNNNIQGTKITTSLTQGESYSHNDTDALSATPTLKYAISNYTDLVTNTKDSRNNYMVQQVPMQSFVPDTEDQNEDNDYLDELDITALVRELIKLETIRNQRQLRRKKKVTKENAKIVGGMKVGDVFKSYFKNKQVAHQKALKKHLLNKARLILRSKGKLSPLPKFS